MLKRVEITGFKSFADQTNIEFGDGITGIVGPNGCGKSNIGDAVRWVLGEQSAKQLRGDNMQDVIFKGAEGRKALSYCEVSLVFDNTDRQFDIEYDEVVISRKLFRSGESEYLLNRVPCLRRDIIGHLHDLGIGGDGYSIIGQGRVGRILNSKPEDRREIFEEAAGIAKFKDRKIESERKLASTRENIVRLQDIYREVENRIGPLREQAENAKKYLAFRDQLKSYEINNYIYCYDNAESNKQEINVAIEGLEQQVELKSKQLQNVVDKNNSSLESIKTIDTQIQQLHNKAIDLSVMLQKKKGDVELANTKLEYMKKESEKLQNELVEQKAEFKEISKQLTDKQQQKSDKIDELTALKTKADEIQKVYLQTIEELNKNEDLVSSSQKDITEKLNQISDIKANISSINTEIASLKERKSQIEKEIVSTQKQFSDAENKEFESKKLRDQFENKQNTIAKELKALKDNLVIVENERKNLNFNLVNTQNKLSSLEARNTMLKEMQVEYEGYSGTVKKLLVDASKNPQLKSQVVGVVGELINVPKQYETAIEMALGSSVQNIVTTNEQDAKKLVSYLKTQNYGRATFLPLNTIKPRFLSTESERLLKQKGIFGVASDLIEFDKQIAPVIKGLLGSTVVVEDMNVAVKLANDAKFGFKIVTLEGDIINPAGSITGGSKKSALNNILSRDREIEENSRLIAEFSKTIEGLNNKLKQYDEIIINLNAQIQSKTEQSHNFEVELAQKDELFKFASETKDNLLSALQLQKDEQTRVTTKIDLLASKLNSIEKLNKNVGFTKSEGVVDSEFDMLRKQRDELSAKLTEFKVQIATLEGEIASIDSDIQRLLSEQESINQDIDETSSLLIKSTQTMETALELSKTSSDVAEEKKTQSSLDVVNNDIAKLEEVKAKLHETIEKIGEERDQLSNELSLAKEKLYQQQSKLEQIDTNIENMQQKILEDYELTYLTAQSFKLPDYDYRQGTIKVNELKREINKLGYVNVNAIEESAELEQRFGDYTVQMEDLLKAEQDILNTIKELSVMMSEKFSEAFEKINSNFSRVFRDLFGGGSAKLVLTTDDPLTAGVDIYAEPPGKSANVKLALLSGGEQTLTAIAILFAILKIRPMPFCLLDEIDAALDDANAERFAKYLHRFAGDTQFIVITHRKPTMEATDALYGVTMENKGVTKIVSVKLSEAIASATQN